MFKHILLATDGSPASERATTMAAGLARQHGARLTALYVVDPYPYLGIGEANPMGFQAYMSAALDHASQAHSRVLALTQHTAFFVLAITVAGALARPVLTLAEDTALRRSAVAVGPALAGALFAATQLTTTTWAILVLAAVFRLGRAQPEDATSVRAVFVGEALVFAQLTMAEQAPFALAAILRRLTLRRTALAQAK